MPQFQLFRIKVQDPVQTSLLTEGMSHQDMVRKALYEKPSAELRKGHTWHIGNFLEIDDQGIYFALGRTTMAIVERYDTSTGNFTEEKFDTAPYTHVVMDTQYQVAAIAAKSKLAPTIPGIGRQFERLINESNYAKQHGIVFEVAEIKDPGDFIHYLASAYAISKFSVSFTLPNPFDVNKDFQEPMEHLLQVAHGKNGKTSIAGPNLDSEVLKELARSSAASGNDAEALLQVSEDQPPIRKHLRENDVTFESDDPETPQLKKEVLTTTRDIYHEVRGDGKA